MRGASVAVVVVMGGLVVACGWREQEPGLRVDVELMHHGGGSGAPGVVQTNLGYQVTLTKAYAVMTKVELLACSSSARVPRHIVGAPTVLGAPQVEDLLGPEHAPELVGTILPPPGVYCTAKIALGPADADAPGLPGQELVGVTAEVEGTYVGAGGQAVAFAGRCAAPAFVSIALDAGAPAVELSAEQRSAEVILSLDVDHVLDDVDLASESDPQVIGCAALANLGRGMHRHVAP